MREKKCTNCSCEDSVNEFSSSQSFLNSFAFTSNSPSHHYTENRESIVLEYNCKIQSKMRRKKIPTVHMMIL